MCQSVSFTKHCFFLPFLVQVYTAMVYRAIMKRIGTTVERSGFHVTSESTQKRKKASCGTDSETPSKRRRLETESDSDQGESKRSNQKRKARRGTDSETPSKRSRLETVTTTRGRAKGQTEKERQGVELTVKFSLLNWKNFQNTKTENNFIDNYN